MNQTVFAVQIGFVMFSSTFVSLFQALRWQGRRVSETQAKISARDLGKGSGGGKIDQ